MTKLRILSRRRSSARKKFSAADEQLLADAERLQIRADAIECGVGHRLKVPDGYSACGTAEVEVYAELLRETVELRKQAHQMRADAMTRAITEPRRKTKAAGEAIQ